MQIKILLVEDQKLMRIGIKSLFTDYPEMEIIGEAFNGKEAVEKTKLIKPDVILMDIGLPDISGIDATKQILEHNNNIKIINKIKFTKIIFKYRKSRKYKFNKSNITWRWLIKVISIDCLCSIVSRDINRCGRLLQDSDYRGFYAFKYLCHSNIQRNAS